MVKIVEPQFGTCTSCQCRGEVVSITVGRENPFFTNEIIGGMLIHLCNKCKKELIEKLKEV